MSVDTFLNPLSSEARALALSTSGFGLCINNPHPKAEGEHYVQNGNQIIAEGISEKPASNAKALANAGQCAAKAALTW